MLYSPLHRSIRRACQDFLPTSYPVLAMTLPLLLSLPAAGAVQADSTPADGMLDKMSLPTAIPLVAAHNAATVNNTSNRLIQNGVSMQDSYQESYQESYQDMDQHSLLVGSQNTPQPLEARQSTLQKTLESSPDIQAKSADTTTVQAPAEVVANGMLTNPLLEGKLPLATQQLADSPVDNDPSALNSPKANSLENDRLENDRLENDRLKNNRLASLSLENATAPHARYQAIDTPNKTEATDTGHNSRSDKLAKGFFDQANVEHSLQKLATFYQHRDKGLTDTDINANTNSNMNTDTNTDAITVVDAPLTADTLAESSVIHANQTAPAAVPTLFNRSIKDPASYRCEGVWITPSNLDGTSSGDVNNSAYAQAIARAKQQDGLSTVNGLPLYAQADYAYYDNQNYIELMGNVEVVKDGQLLSAEQMALDLTSGIAGMTGDIVLAESSRPPSSNLQAGDNLSTNMAASGATGSGLIVVAKDMAYDTTNSRATAHDVAFASVPLQAHGYAKTLNKPDDDHYELDKVMFSTCPPSNRKWQLEAEQIDIDTQTGRGKAYDATFRLQGVPVFYLPYFNFPIDDRRSSGILTPSASLSSDKGLKLSVPYYVNLAPNYDATLTTDIYSNRNPMLAAELRYLTQGYGNGGFTATYLPHDKEYNDADRRGFFYQHAWTSDSLPNLSASAVYNYVSDPEYLNDFDNFNLTGSRLNLPRRAQVSYYNDYINTQLKVETFQSLKAVDANGVTIQDKDKPYSRLPQLSVNYRLPKLNNALDTFLITGTHNSAYFKKTIVDDSENEKSGVRVYNSVAASYPMQTTWGHLTPKLNLQHLYAAYDEQSRIDNAVNKNDNNQSVFVPQFSVDSALNFYQAGSPFGWFNESLGGYQLLTPRLKYTYSPFVEQSNIPNFNTRIASIDYNQLFADSWFLGYDRLPDNNNLSLGINYRYLDAMGVTRFDGSIGDQFYLQDNTVTLDTVNQLPSSNGAIPKRQSANNRIFGKSSSGVAWQSSVQPYRNIWFDFNGALSANNDVNFVNSQIRYQPTPYSLLNVGFIKRDADANTNQDALSAITASALLPLTNSWRLMAQGQFDNRNDKLIDATVGVDYEDCCYGFSIYGRSYYNDLNLENKPTNAVMAEFRINGIGDKRSGFSKILSNKIVGFEPVDTLWTK